MTFGKNLIMAFAAQGVGFVASLVTSFVVPKLLGVSEFGYWQLFMFYTTYVGFFHFGLNDGVYLLLGGKKRDEVDKRSVNSQFLFGLIYQAIISLSILFISLIFISDGGRQFVWMSTAVFLLLYNVTYFFGSLFQAMNETKLFSLSTVVDRFTFLILLFVLLLNRVNKFEYYVACFAISKTVSMVFCLYHAKDFLKSGRYPLSTAAGMSLSSIRVGSKLMFANIADMLILGATRFFIDCRWGIEVFGEVSFSLSMVTFFISFVSQASMVLFPTLRLRGNEVLSRLYQEMRGAMLVLFPALYALYFPMVWLIGNWLPQYEGSLHYFALLLPICVFNTKMDLSCTTYLKVLREEKLLLKLNIATVVISASLSFVGVYAFHSVDIALLGSVGAIIGRACLSERIIDRKMRVSHTSMMIGEVALTFMFIVIALRLERILGLSVYIACYFAYLICFKNDTRTVLNNIKARLLN